MSRCRSLWPASVGAVLGLGAVLACVGCAGFGTTPIADILDDPRGYDGKTVRIHGEVTGSLNVIVVKGYTVRDGSGEIMVITEHAVPGRGQAVTVKGRVSQAFAVGDQSLVVVVEEGPR